MTDGAGRRTRQGGKGRGRSDGMIDRYIEAFRFNIKMKYLFCVFENKCVGDLVRERWCGTGFDVYDVWNSLIGSARR